MQISMHNVLVPTANRMLGNVLVLFDKTEAFAAQKKIEPSVLLNSRLAPDMFALTRQLQIACDTVKGAAARLTGTEIPSHPDTETSFADLRARIAKTLDFINGIDAAKYAGSEDRDIVLNMRTGEMRFKGLDYLLHFVLPNFYFHVTTIYAILRHNGVELGKQDFLGKP
jgi:hypothetical protein